MNSSAGVLCAESLGQEKFAPRTKMLNEESRFPAENYQYFPDAGLLALMVPREFGGRGGKLGLSARAYHRVLIAARTISNPDGEREVAPSMCRRRFSTANSTDRCSPEPYPRS